MLQLQLLGSTDGRVGSKGVDEDWFTPVASLVLKLALLLDRSLSFKKGYRNVAVLKKMTFPNDKVLSIELSEKQISGRTISLQLDYEDVLSADSFSSLLLREQ